MSTNPLIAFIQENFVRLTQKSPKFFKVWKIITGIPVLVIALPNALEVLNINLPQIFNQHVQDVVGWAATAAFLMTFLPVDSKVVAVDQNGTAVKQSSEKLPFTVIQEQKQLDKDIANPKTPNIETVVIPDPVEPKSKLHA